jgi:hypothetical protein
MSKIKNKLWIMALLLTVSMTGCGSNHDSGGGTGGGGVGGLGVGPAPVNLGSTGGTANNFVILSETAVTDTGSHLSVVTGNIGLSPATAASIGVFCSEMTGIIYGVDATYVGSGTVTCFAGNPPLANKTLVDTAVADMGTAYTDAAGRTLPTATELGAGDITSMTIAPGLYKWGTGVLISAAGVTLSGGANDTWIFQMAGDLTVANGAIVTLAGGAEAKNIVWQVGGPTGATLGTTSNVKGTILSAKQIILQTGATLHGRALAQTQVTLDAATVAP